jgi:Na+-transporting NADH:ubiquinone oxidoreductase subunit C
MTAIGLKDKQQKNIELEKKTNILSVAMKLEEGADVEAIYAARVKSYVIDYTGKQVPNVKAEQIVIVSEYKKAPESRMLPVYEITSAEDPSKTETYVLPLYGFGLWDNIWGFVALQADLETINGVRFDHKAETPGLGARIATEEIQNRFVGKKIYDASAQLVGVKMMKGEGNDYSQEPNLVDGMSGATITGTGVGNMIVDYLQCYNKFLSEKKNSNNTALLIP